MRSHALMIAAVSLLASAPAGAQRASQLPEYVGQVNAVHGSRTIPLERQNARNDFKIRAMGFGGGKMRLLVEGERSPVRFRSGDPISFVIRVASQDTDPAEFIRLLPVKSRKGTREMETLSTGFAGVTGARDRLNERAIPFDASRSGAQGFRITLREALRPGEYAIQTSGAGSLSLFGVD